MKARRLALGWSCAALLLGCASRPHAPRTPAIVVTSLSVLFPERDRGELTFALRLPPGETRVTEVAWELFLDGERFATGLEGEVPPREGLFPVRTALVSRHLGWKEGEGALDVLLLGEVDLGKGGERQRFRERRELVVQGRPQLKIPRD